MALLALGWLTYTYADLLVAEWQWHSYKRAAKARGVVFDTALEQGTVADADNLALLPTFSRAKKRIPDKGSKWVWHPLGGMRPRPNSIRDFRMLGSDVSTRIFSALDSVEPTLAPAREALKRRHARYVSNPSGLSAFWDEHERIMEFIEASEWRARGFAALGQTKESLAEVQMMLRLASCLPRDWTMSRRAIVSSVANWIREGIEARVWSDAELQLFSNALAEKTALEELQASIDIYRSQTDNYISSLLANPERLPNESFLRKAGDIFALAAPRGWVRREQIQYHRWLEDAMSDINREKKLLGERYFEVDAEINHRHIVARRESATLVGMFDLPPGGDIFEVEARCAMIRLLTAAARHEIRHGTLPDRASDLVPSFLVGVPLDPMDGQPLRYRREADGGCTVWSIGWDRVDDNAPERDPKTRGKSPDWIWKLAPTPALPSR